MSNEEKEWKVYLIRAGTKEYHPVKIGYTSNIEERFYNIQVCNPSKLRLLCLLPCESKRHAQLLENFLHKQLYKGCNIQGEWFNIKGRNIPKLVNKFTSCYKGLEDFKTITPISGKSYNLDIKNLQKENSRLKKELKIVKEKLAKAEQDAEEFLDGLYVYEL